MMHALTQYLNRAQDWASRTLFLRFGLVVPWFGRTPDDLRRSDVEILRLCDLDLADRPD